jgi:hypothetical protein
LRTLLIGVLAATLVGCSREPSPQAAMPSCASPNPIAAVRLPIESMSFGSNSATTTSEADVARHDDSLAPAHARPAARLAGRTAKTGRIAAKTVSRIPLPRARDVRSAGSAGAATSDATRTNIAGPHPTVDAANTRTIQEQVAAATVIAERLTIARALAAPKANNRDRSNQSETAEDGKGVKAASASEEDANAPVAILMARVDVRSVSELSGKTIAIDDRYSAYNGSVRSAIAAAGAREVQLSEAQTTAFNRLISGEVAGAVLTLVSAEAAESFPDITGFKIFHVPLRLVP